MVLNSRAYDIADSVADRLCLVELIERLARLRRYLRQEEEHGDRPQQDVVRVFLAGVNGLLRSLDPYVKLLSSGQVLHKYERISFTRRMTTLFSLFADLHAQLSHLKGTWARPESQLFIQNVCELLPDKRLPKTISVVLQNEYSFEQDDLASGLNSLFLGSGVALHLPQERPTIFLPKAEHDNPLYWANLAHECGHIDRAGIKTLIDDPAFFPSEATDAEKATLKHWAEELYCDLFATKILGPAYLVSFLAFTLLETDLIAGEYGSASHPPDVVRICMMQRVLENRGLTICLKGDLSDFGDIVRLYYLTYESRSRTLRQQYQGQDTEGFLTTCTPPPHISQMSGAVFSECVDRIVEQIDEVIYNERELKPADFERTATLAGRLADGVLIGSYADEIAVKDCLRSKGIGESSETNGRNGVLNDELDLETFNRLKPLIQEARTTPWEIINAGWLHKIQTIHTEAFTLFYKNDGALLDKIDHFDAKLQASDDVLLKSIEVAQIHKAFERQGR